MTRVSTVRGVSQKSLGNLSLAEMVLCRGKSLDRESFGLTVGNGGESDVAGDERSDDDEPKRDKAAGFRALLEKEQREIRQRKKAKRKVAGIFEEEASEDEDEAQEGLGEYGDQVSL